MNEKYKNIISDLVEGQPKSKTWKPYLTSEVSWKIYSLMDPETGYLQFKSFGTLPYSTDVIFNTMHTRDYRMYWDSYDAVFFK